MPSHDVLIIGAGLAGQRAALAAARAGATVAIMSKVHPVRSHSNAAAGGINAALNPDDSWESHAFDTVKGSDYPLITPDRWLADFEKLGFDEETTRLILKDNAARLLKLA